MDETIIKNQTNEIEEADNKLYPYAVINDELIRRGVLSTVSWSDLYKIQNSLGLNCYKREMVRFGKGIMIKSPYLFSFGLKRDNFGKIRMNIAFSERGEEMNDEALRFFNEIMVIEDWIKSEILRDCEISAGRNFGLSAPPTFRRFKIAYESRSSNKMMSLKLMTMGKNVKTRFLDEEGSAIDNAELFDRYFRVKFGLHIVGVIVKDNNITLDVRVVIAKIKRFDESKRTVRFVIPDDI